MKPCWPTCLLRNLGTPCLEFKTRWPPTLPLSAFIGGKIIFAANRTGVANPPAGASQLVWSSFQCRQQPGNGCHRTSRLAPPRRCAVRSPARSAGCCPSTVAGIRQAGSGRADPPPHGTRSGLPPGSASHRRLALRSTPRPGAAGRFASAPTDASVGTSHCRVCASAGAGHGPRQGQLGRPIGRGSV